MLNISDIQKNNPKSHLKLKEFVGKLLNVFQKSLSSTKERESLIFPDITDEIINRYTELSIPTQPRMLYEFFDAAGIKIGIAPSLVDDKLWTYFNSVDKISKVAPNRIEAEELAFTDAFTELEKKLNG